MSRETGYELMRARGGTILQSGIRSSSPSMHHPIDNIQGWITMAVVIKTYYPEEDTRSGWTEGQQRKILCDVRTYGMYSRFLAKVPVLQRVAGLYDRDFYVPRDSRQDLEGGALATGGTKSAATPTPAENMDGDHVLIGFLDNNPAQPFIFPFTLGHPKANFVPELADGRVRQIRHQGTLIAWDKDGNFTIDAREVAAEELGPGGAEVPAPGKGTITFVNQDAVGGQLSVVLDASSTPGKVLIGSDPETAADEPFVCGNLLKSWLEDIIDALVSHNHPTAATGPVSPPHNAADLTSLKGQISGTLSEFIMGKKSQ